MNIFQEVKSAVWTKDAAALYGIKVGRNKMACCQFHPDKNPSMKVDNRFHCFGCGADGDVINFVEKLYGLTPIESAKKLITDFNLNIDLRSPYKQSESEIKQNKEKEQLRAFQLYKRDALNFLREYYYVLHCAKRDLAPKTPEDLEHCNPLFEEALNNLHFIDWMIEELDSISLEEQIAFLNTYKEVVARVKERVITINESRN